MKIKQQKNIKAFLNEEFGEKGETICLISKKQCLMNLLKIHRINQKIKWKRLFKLFFLV